MAGQSQELIKQLVDAEKRAEDIVATAKKNRLIQLRSAKDKAEADLDGFRKEQQEKFDQETSRKAAADPVSELKGATQAQIASVDEDYAKNKKKTVDFITEKILSVPVGLTSTQKQALKAGMA
eukprot:TRINITY_DN1897_c2_g1_i1.p1 TRINITY_DN1897_c2_g1~~TRINITY_DN1897_c2_g1_i1.p1  ORF type:complete len:144 (-),score=34.22 TRINITY_DN1897_c2_g1_i1:96-464(-)